MKTLIVEDDATSSIILQKLLSRYGEASIAMDGEKAVESFQSGLDSGEPFDLICLDIMMPKMDGHEVLTRIREMERGKGINGLDRVKIVMTTALEDPENVMAAFKEECDTYLTKPIFSDVLLEKLRDLGLLD